MTKARTRRFVSDNEPVRLKVDVDHCKAGDIVKIAFPKGSVEPDGKVDISRLVIHARCNAGKSLLLIADDIT